MHLAVGGMRKPRFVIYHRAQGRRSPVHSALNQISLSIREQLLPGQHWWADIGHVHPPDWNGEMCTKTFAEEKYLFAILLHGYQDHSGPHPPYQTFHGMGTETCVPGGKFTVLRMDFGSEASRQAR